MLLEDHMQGATAPPPKGLDAKGQERYWAQRSDYALLHWAAPRAGSRGGRHACAALGSLCSDCESLQASALALGRSGEERGGGGRAAAQDAWLRAVAPPRAPQPSRGRLCTGGDVMAP